VALAPRHADVLSRRAAERERPDLNAIRDGEARSRCIAGLAPTDKGPANALVYDYQIVVRGRAATPPLA